MLRIYSDRDYLDYTKIGMVKIGVYWDVRIGDYLDYI